MPGAGPRGGEELRRPAAVNARGGGPEGVGRPGPEGGRGGEGRGGEGRGGGW